MNAEEQAEEIATRALLVAVTELAGQPFEKTPQAVRRITDKIWNEVIIFRQETKKELYGDGHILMYMAVLKVVFHRLAHVAAEQLIDNNPKARAFYGPRDTSYKN